MQFFNNNNYIPPNPIGGGPDDFNNSIPIGGFQGYNHMGGYYTNDYGYYNPYLEEERKKQEAIQKREQARQQYDLMKAISMSASKCTGNSINEQQLEDMYAPVYEEDISSELKNQLMLLNTHYNVSENATANMIFEAQNRVYEYRQTLVPKDCNFNEFMDKSVNLVDDILKDEERHRNAENMSRLYNKDGYKKILGEYSGDSDNYFSSMYDNNDPLNTSIDDVESVLPPYGQSENVAARETFMNRILMEIEKRNAGGYGLG